MTNRSEVLSQDGLKVAPPVIPGFYIQQKIHKDGKPGRLVISSLEHQTFKTSEYADFLLQPIVQQITSYVKETTDFLRKLDAIKSVPNHVYLVSRSNKICSKSHLFCIS